MLQRFTQIPSKENGVDIEAIAVKGKDGDKLHLGFRGPVLRDNLVPIMVLDFNRIPKDRCGLGSTLVLKNINSGEEKTFYLVFPEEVNPDEGKISLASPIGKAMIGKMEGDEVNMSLAGEDYEYEVLQLTTIHSQPGIQKD